MAFLATAPHGWEIDDEPSLWTSFVDQAANQGVSVEQLQSFSGHDLDEVADEYLVAQAVPKMRCGLLKAALRQWAAERGNVEWIPLGVEAKVKVFFGQPLGFGGQGDVFAGQMTPSGSEVAVKRIQDSSLGERERQLLELLADCPHVVKLHASARHRGSTWLVLEAVQGGSVAERLANSGAMTEDEAAKAAGNVLAALSHAADLGLLHRDIKPDNLLLTPTGTKLADFGLARHDHSVTSQSGLKGTPLYMSAAALDGRFSHMTDVHALGVCVLVMLKGDDHVYDDSVTYPYVPHYSLTKHIQQGNLPLVPSGASHEAHDFVESCFCGHMQAKQLLQHQWIASREPLKTLHITRERSAGHWSAGRRGHEALGRLQQSHVVRDYVALEGVRSFLHRGWNLHAEAVGKMLEQLIAQCLIEARTLTIKDCSDERIQRIAASCGAQGASDCKVTVSLMALREAARLACIHRSDKLASLWLHFSEGAIRKSLHPFKLEMKMLAEVKQRQRELMLEQQRQEDQQRLERQRRAEQERLDRQRREDEQRRREQELRELPELQRRAQNLLHVSASRLLRQGDRVYLHGSDYSMMMSILQRHPNARNKIGCGVRGIFVANTSYVCSPCFHAERMDGSVIDFSYRKCLDMQAWPRGGYDSRCPGPPKRKGPGFHQWDYDFDDLDF